MAVIWGLDLKEMQWRKFSNSYMWADTYHLRRTKFIVYQLAMILCVVSESLGTDVLSSQFLYSYMLSALVADFQARVPRPAESRRKGWGKGRNSRYDPESRCGWVLRLQHICWRLRRDHLRICLLLRPLLA